MLGCEYGIDKSTSESYTESHFTHDRLAFTLWFWLAPDHRHRFLLFPFLDASVKFSRLHKNLLYDPLSTQLVPHIIVPANFFLNGKCRQFAFIVLSDSSYDIILRYDFLMETEGLPDYVYGEMLPTVMARSELFVSGTPDKPHIEPARYSCRSLHDL